tara:strand:+ start:675 stop:932 length:258 start_codon:yes stop_codon:yes gene_type:complete
MINFKKFINLHAEKKCPPGYKFDEKLGVCVPKGERGYYPFYGIGSRNGDTSSSPAPSDSGNGNGNGNSNGNGNGGNGNGGNGGGE